MTTRPADLQLGPRSAQNLYLQSADGSDTAERLTSATDGQFASAISADAAQVIAAQLNAKTGSDLVLLRLGHNNQTVPLLPTPFNERNADVSPDGRWLAYESDESGRDEIYVRSFLDVKGRRWQISTPVGRSRCGRGPDASSSTSMPKVFSRSWR